MTQPTRQQMDDYPPATVPGSLAWLVQHFGPWVLPTLIMGFASWTLWLKYDESNKEVVKLLVANIQAAGETSKAMSEVAKTLSGHGDEGKQRLTSMAGSVENIHEDLAGVHNALLENAATSRDNNKVLHEIKIVTEKLQTKY